MIVTDRFVFLHLHKSGGSFVNECLRRHWPGVREIGYHLPRSLVPAAFAQLPVIGLVRNPWSYYVSWYSFQQQRSQPNALFQILSDGDGWTLAAPSTICWTWDKTTRCCCDCWTYCRVTMGHKD